MATAGFGRRRIPDGRVLRICARTDDVTISRIGRELGITRQGASKIVGNLHDDGYVTLHASLSDGRETLVRPTRHATDYLAAHRKAADEVERRLRKGVGTQAIDGLYRALEELASEGQPPAQEYLRSRSHGRMGPDD
jgi:DNA-binding MarR family transcriptional regulator